MHFKEKEMTVLEIYKDYRIFKPRENGLKNKRIYIDGSGINCNQYWYNIQKAREWIDFTLMVKNLEKQIKN